MRHGGSKGRRGGGGRKSRSPSQEDEDDDTDDHHRRRVAKSPLPQLPGRDALEEEGTFPAVDDDEQEEDEEDEDDGALEVLIETLTGASYRVRVSPWDTAAGLKALLYRTQGIPSSQQHLLLGQHELNDDICLIEQGVTEKAVLRLVVALKGGPLNARRLPSNEDVIWREVSEFMESNRDDLWEGTPSGRTVTLLVLRDGENVNLYRVIENEDGSFSPLNESWTSFLSTAGSVEEEGETEAVREEDDRMRTRMADLRAKMAAAKLKTHAQTDNGDPQRSAEKFAGQRRNKSKQTSKEKEKLQKGEMKTSHSDVSQKPSSHPFTQPKNGNYRGHSTGSRILASRGSRPTTQEHVTDSRRNSLSRMSGMLDELPNAIPPRHIDFSRRKPLENIRPQTERLTLGRVEEERGKRSPASNASNLPQIESNVKHVESRRNSLVKHKQVGVVKALPVDVEAREQWPKRQGAVPLYMPEIEYKGRRKDIGPLHQSQHYIRLPRAEAEERPKTSPVVLEHRPSSMGGKLRDHMRIQGTDEYLRELVSILNNSRSGSCQSVRSIDIARDATNVASGINTYGLRKSKSISHSVVSLRSKVTSSPIPGPGALVASGTREKRTLLRELMQDGVLQRKSPDGGKKGSKRPVSSRKLSSPKLPPVTPSRRKRVNRRLRCEQCTHRLGVTTTYYCRCGRAFCSQHRYAETHSCTFDYKTEGRKMLQLANPVLTPHKLPKI